ncbi:MAG: acyl carrier protein phosphodiesterase [Bacteroidales bacterium]|nr:acyl carrier protein phosphodiesterase [Bacteroidales bacterium]
MNFLAHIYLSGKNPLVKIGNFAGDWIKGNISSAEKKYPSDMVLGIKMHRFIDSFTDSSDIVQTSVSRLKKHFGLYASIVNDVVYDYFLATNWEKYSDENLDDFCNSFYSYCLKYYDILPPQVKEVIPHLILSKRLQSYKTLEGIKAALKTMSEKTSLPDLSDKAVETIKENQSAYQNEFSAFWETIRKETAENFLLK